MIKYFILTLILTGIFVNSYAGSRAIDEMFAVMNMEEQMKGGFEAMLPVIDQTAAQLKLDTKGKDELIGVFRAWYDEDIDRSKLIEEMKVLYKKRFSDEEIKQITEFYKTPTGMKFIKVSPELMKKGAELGMKEAQLKQGELMNRLKPLLEKHASK